MMMAMEIMVRMTKMLFNPLGSYWGIGIMETKMESIIIRYTVIDWGYTIFIIFIVA